MRRLLKRNRRKIAGPANPYGAEWELLNGCTDIPPQANLAVIDSNVEPTLRVVTDPCFVHDGSAVSTVVR